MVQGSTESTTAISFLRAIIVDREEVINFSPNANTVTTNQLLLQGQKWLCFRSIFRFFDSFGTTTERFHAQTENSICLPFATAAVVGEKPRGPSLLPPQLAPDPVASCSCSQTQRYLQRCFRGRLKQTGRRQKRCKPLERGVTSSKYAHSSTELVCRLLCLYKFQAYGRTSCANKNRLLCIERI